MERHTEEDSQASVPSEGKGRQAGKGALQGASSCSSGNGVGAGFQPGSPKETKLRKVVRNETEPWGLGWASQGLPSPSVSVVYTLRTGHPGSPAQELTPYHPHVMTSFILKTTKPQKGSGSS